VPARGGLAKLAEVYPRWRTCSTSEVDAEIVDSIQKRIQEIEAIFTRQNTGTKALLEEYLADAGNAGIPVGFLRAPGMQMKIEMRFSENCERHGEGNGAFCNKMKIKYEVEDDNSDGDEESDDDKGDVVDGSTDAIEAIADAIAVIDALKAAVEVSTEKAEVIDDAEAAVKAAEIALASAQAKLAVDALDEAETFASEAERIADDAYEVLVGEEFESERNVDEKGDDESNDETLLEGDE